MKFRRKDFFKAIALGTISMPFLLRSVLSDTKAQGKSANVSGRTYNWKMVTTWPPNFPILGEACQAYADMVEKMSGGRMNIQVYGGGELVPALECFDTVRSGAAEIGSGAAYYWAGKTPAAQFFASVPFGMNAQQVTAWIYDGGGMELWEELYAKYSLIPMLGGNTGVQMGGWFNKEINTIEDFKGLKMRIPGLGGKVLEKAGGAPVLLAGGEIYTGLERGIIDATEWLGPYHDTQMGFDDIARYYYSPGWHEPGTALEYIFNKEKFESLPPDLQAILRTASYYINNWVMARMEARNAATLAKLKDKGVEIRTFSPEILEQLRKHTDEVIADITAKDAFARKVYESYNDFRQKASAYANITERLFYSSIQAI